MNSRTLRCDIFCTVIDNYGDAAVSWRLARQLARDHAWQVRLWIDDPTPLAQLVPNLDDEAVVVQQWTDAANAIAAPEIPDIVIEAFACSPPDGYITAMAQRTIPPIWINLEYLSAEPWIDDCHGMVSRHPRLPLEKTFFFPGFSPHCGGVLVELDYVNRRTAFDEAKFRQELELPPRLPDDVVVSMFSYPNPRLDELLTAWQRSEKPIHLLWPGMKDKPRRHGNLHIWPLPFLPQLRYDELLWCADLNFVRGEDSFVRAQLAGKPMVWHIYQQEDDAHLVKLDAFLDRYTKYHPFPETVRQFWRGWNDAEALGWESFAAHLPRMRHHALDWSMELIKHTDLASSLVQRCLERLEY